MLIVALYLDNDGAITVNLLLVYFLLGMRLCEILIFLKNEDAITISMSTTLSRHLELLGLFRLETQSGVLEVIVFVQKQLNKHEMLPVGLYEFMHLKCIQAGLVVTQKNCPLLYFCLAAVLFL